MESGFYRMLFFVMCVVYRLLCEKCENEQYGVFAYHTLVMCVYYNYQYYRSLGKISGWKYS